VLHKAHAHAHYSSIWEVRDGSRCLSKTGSACTAPEVDPAQASHMPLTGTPGLSWVPSFAAIGMMSQFDRTPLSPLTRNSTRLKRAHCYAVEDALWWRTTGDGMSHSLLMMPITFGLPEIRQEDSRAS
jgi:hypothetical protein